MKLKLLVVILILILLGTGCNTINPVEQVPTYIRIDSVNFAVNDPVIEGTTSQKITSVWVYFNNQQVGVFDIPATIPIIASAPGQVTVFPGVTYKGLSGVQVQYPFVTFDSMQLTPSPGNVIPFTPALTYYPGIKFPWKEDFELGSSFIEVNGERAGDTSVVRTTDADKVFEGTASGYIYLDANHPSSENIAPSDGFPITQGKSYLEINYKCNTSFQVGLLTNVSGTIVYEYMAGVKANEKWNKLYIDLAPFTAKHKTSTYRVLVKTSLDEGLSTGYVLMDNLKVVSF